MRKKVKEKKSLYDFYFLVYFYFLQEKQFFPNKISTQQVKGSKKCLKLLRKYENYD